MNPHEQLLHERRACPYTRTIVSYALSQSVFTGVSSPSFTPPPIALMKEYSIVLTTKDINQIQQQIYHIHTSYPNVVHPYTRLTVSHGFLHNLTFKYQYPNIPTNEGGVLALTSKLTHLTFS